MPHFRPRWLLTLPRIIPECVKASDYSGIILDKNDRNDSKTFMSKHTDNTYNEYQLK